MRSSSITDAVVDAVRSINETRETNNWDNFARFYDNSNGQLISTSKQEKNRPQAIRSWNLKHKKAFGADRNVDIHNFAQEKHELGDDIRNHARSKSAEEQRGDDFGPH